MISAAVTQEVLLRVTHDSMDKRRTEFARTAILALRDARPEEDHEPVPTFACPGYPFESKAALPACPGSCTICTAQYFSHPYQENPSWRKLLDMHSDAQAAAAAQGFVDSANKDLALVRERIGTHGDALLKRWTRRSVKKRAELVLKAMPEASPDNFAWARMQNDLARSFSAFLHECRSTSAGGAKAAQKLQDLSSAYEARSRKMHLLPYCDAQTLSEDPMALLSILHHRANSDSADWVTFDMEQTKLAFEALIACLPYNPHAVVMYGTHYGRLIPWNKQSSHRLDIIGYPRAVVTLEAQSVLAGFLRTMVDLILENDIDVASQGRSQWNALVTSGFHWTPGPLSRRLDAFNAPPQYDLEAVVRMLEERHRAMVDEIEGLQSDPLYFRNHIRRIQDNQREFFALHLTLTYILWADLLQLALARARFARVIQKQYRGLIQVGRALPLPYACALSLLEEAFADLFEGQLSDLIRLQVYTKTFGDHYVKDQERSGPTREELLRSRPLLWNAQQLPLKQKTSPSSRWFLSFVDYLMARDMETSQPPVDDHLALHFSNMIVVSDVLASVRSHRPRADVAADNEMLQQLRQLQPAGNTSGMKQSGFCMWQGTQEWPSLKPFLDLPLPTNKISRLNMTQHQNLRRAAEQFWDSLADLLRSDIQASGADVNHPKSPELMVRYGHTQKYKEEVEDEYRSFERAIVNKEEAQARRARQSSELHANVLSCPLWQSGVSTPSAISNLEHKVKVKTRQAAVADSSSSSEADDSRRSINSPVSRLTLQVRRGSKKVFEKMFPVPGAQLRDVSWETFVAAMVDAGCSVRLNGGSMFTFKDIKNSKASIVFHHRHPDSTVDPSMLKNMGRRLRKWFGWDEETFTSMGTGTD
ncbi:hypothetical protein LTR15_010435 [Elasticomyces elasticus]|nr:hypothetical protein LTR15_010435 [Elasticomyces elasticus]